MLSILVVSPCFPRPDQATDGQSIYVVEATRALSARLGRPLRVLSLRIGDQAPFERGDFYEVERVEPPSPVPDVFSLYEPAHFPSALQPLALRAASIAIEAKARGEEVVGWLHGYECGEVARRLRAANVPTVGVVHYCVADESHHFLASGADPLRAHLLPPVVSRLSRWTPERLRAPLVTAAGLGAPMALRLPLPGVVDSQLRKLAAERSLFTASDRLVAVGERFARTLRRRYPAASARVRWCHAGAPPSRPRAEGWTRHEGRRRLLVVGRPTPQKGWDYLVSALAELERAAPDVADRLEVTFVGAAADWRGGATAFAPGVLSSLGRLARVRVANPGRMTRTEVQAAFDRADAFLFPSVYEPFGLVLLEAMAAGCPVLASDADGPADVVDPSFGVTVPFDDPGRRVARLRAALQTFASLPVETLEAMSQAASRAALGYRWADCAERHLSFCEEAVRARH